MRVALAFCFALSACATFPQLEGAISDAARNAPYPVLTPVPPAPAVAGDTQKDLQTRIAALQAKADLIRQIDIAALQ